MAKRLNELLKMELIGLNVKITSKNISMDGKIIDETKNMFTIRTKKGDKKIIKKNCKIEFDIDNEKIEIDGEHLAKRPDERIKTKVRL